MRIRRHKGNKIKNEEEEWLNTNEHGRDEYVLQFLIVLEMEKRTSY